MKHLKFLAFIALAIFMASCDDENTEKFNEKFTLKQSNKVTNLSKGSSSVYAAEYTYDIDYVDGTMDITASGVKFSPFMPAITFVINDVEFHSRPLYHRAQLPAHHRISPRPRHSGGRYEAG